MLFASNILLLISGILLIREKQEDSKLNSLSQLIFDELQSKICLKKREIERNESGTFGVKRKRLRFYFKSRTFTT